MKQKLQFVPSYLTKVIKRLVMGCEQQQMGKETEKISSFDRFTVDET